MEDFTTETTEGTENGRWYQGNSSQEISSNQKNILPFFTDPHPLFSLLSPLSLRSVSSVVSVVKSFSNFIIEFSQVQSPEVAM